MKKVTKTKRITIDKLAVIIKNSFEGLETRVVGVIKEEITGVNKEIEGVKNQLAGVSKRIDDFVVTRVKYEDHNKLKARVDIIEKNLK